MSQISFPICLSSADSSDVFPKNTAYSFTVELPLYMHLTGKWTVTLEALFIRMTSGFTSQTTCAHVLLDCVSPSLIYNRKEPILATLPICEKTNAYSYHLSPIGEGAARVEKKAFTRIQVDIVSDNFQHCYNLTGKTVLQLRFTNEECQSSRKDK